MSQPIPEYPTHRADVEMEVMPDGSALLYDPRIDQGHILTSLSGLVWDMCDGSQTVDAIADACAALLPQDPHTAQTVHMLITSFAELHLLEEMDPS
jgi:hypothetical protein